MSHRNTSTILNRSNRQKKINTSYYHQRLPKCLRHLDGHINVSQKVDETKVKALQMSHKANTKGVI